MALRKPAPAFRPSIRNAGSLDARALVGSKTASRRRSAMITVAAEKGLPATSATSAAIMLQSTNDLKLALRMDILEVQEAIAEDVWPTEVTVTNAEGKEVLVTLTSRDEAQNLLETLEQRLNQASDLSQQQQLALQDAQSQQAQAMQTISNIMKNQHDTLKAIIQNLRA